MDQAAAKQYELQRSLVNGIEQSAGIAAVLAQAKLSIDDLVYENSRKLKWRGERPQPLESFDRLGDDIPLVSFFAGGGGLDLGFEALGFKQVAAFEVNEVFCNTLRLNRPQWRVFGPPDHRGDVSDREGIAASLRPLVQAPFEGIFVGGPPCQPFSIAANQRFSKSGANFKRTGFQHGESGNLLFDFIALVDEFKPAAFLIENVCGLRDIDGGKQLAIAMETLKAAGYAVNPPQVGDASRQGVPQFRQRIFLIGARVPGKFAMPPPKRQIGCGSVLSKPPAPGAFNHETRNHRAGSIRRYMGLNYGERDRLGRVDRLNPTKPAKTVIAGGTKGGGRSHLHPEIPRTLSVRECARLQTFPNNYRFTGPMARQFTQVGNAVPPLLAAALAKQLAKAYF